MKKLLYLNTALSLFLSLCASCQNNTSETLRLPAMPDVDNVIVEDLLNKFLPEETVPDTTIYSLHTDDDDESDACNCGNPVAYDKDTPAIIMIDDKWGFVNANGKIIIEPQFDCAAFFAEGLAEVRIGDYETGKWGFIDKSGHFVINPRFECTMAFQEGLAAVRVKIGGKDKWGFIDRTGQFVVAPQYDEVLSYNRGIAQVMIGDKVGYIDRHGDVIIEPLYDGISEFSEGLACVEVDGSYGYINMAGVMIIEPQYDMAGCFSNGLARVCVGEKWGYIDSDGDFVILPTYDYAEDFEEDGTALVTVNNGESYSEYYIDNQGRHLFEADYDTDDIG